MEEDGLRGPTNLGEAKRLANRGCFFVRALLVCVKKRTLFTLVHTLVGRT